jgi:NitT/TauT family transport system permease protein
MSISKHKTYHRQTLGQRLYVMLVFPLTVAIVLSLIYYFLSATPLNVAGVTLNTYLLALGATFARMTVAFILALAVSIPLALLATRSPRYELIFLPLFDIFESIPFIAFFPVVILFFIKANSLNGAAIVILFMAMVWNIVFTIVGGLKIIPSDIMNVARLFGLKGLTFFRRVTLPAIVPQIVTGSILAFAQGWNISIVAEALHVYLPHGSPSDDLFGIGSVLVQAASSSETNVFIIALVVMIIGIAFLNFFVWQKLLHYAQRFKFE